MADKNQDYVVLDVDGTFFYHEYPSLGAPAPGAVRVCKRFNKAGIPICLNTMRSDEKLDQAVEAIEAEGVELYGVNDNPDQHTWTNSPKVYGTFHIDDSAAGCPLIYPEDGGKPYVDWDEIERLAIEKGLLTEKDENEAVS